MKSKTTIFKRLMACALSLAMLLSASAIAGFGPAAYAEDIAALADIPTEASYTVGANATSGIEDKMLFASDYAIWEPKWQVEGFVDWEMPDDSELADYPRLNTEGKKKILGLNAAKLYGIEVPAGFAAAGAAQQDDAQLVEDAAAAQGT